MSERRWQRYRPPARDDVRRESRDTEGDPLPADLPANRQAPPAPPWWTRRRATVGIPTLIGAGVLGAVLLGQGPGSGEAPIPEGEYRPMLEQSDYDAIVAGLQQRTGSTEILELYVSGDEETRINVTAAPADSTELADVYQWDGTTLELYQAVQPHDRASFDLRDLDPAALVAADLEARDRSGEPIGYSYAFVRVPTTDDGEWISVHAEETDRGSLTVWADLDGNVLDDYDSEED